MNHIIVPIDFSDESLHGLELAILLSKKIPSKIQMVYVQKKSSDIYIGSRDEEKAFAQREFKKIVDTYSRKLYEGSEIGYIIKAGKIYTEIVNQANSFKHSFISASTHGASGFENIFIGSNAFKIVTATTKPVFTIRSTKPPTTIRKIVLPIDFSPDSRQKVPFTVEMAEAFKAKIHVVTVSSTNRVDIQSKLANYQNQTIEYIKKHKIDYKADNLIGSNITDITIEYAQKVKADLISIMTEQSKDVSNFVMGSYAQQMLNKSDIPVLCITPKELHIGGNFSTQG